MDEKTTCAANSRSNPNFAAPSHADVIVAGNDSKEEGEISCSDDGNDDLCTATRPLCPTGPTGTYLANDPANEAEPFGHSPALNAKAIGNPAVKSANISQPGLKEPPRKRLKVGEPHQSQQGLEHDMAGVNSCSPRKDLLLETGSKGNIPHVAKGPDQGKGESTLPKLRGLDTALMETSQVKTNGGRTGTADQLKQTSRMNMLHHAHQDTLSSRCGVELSRVKKVGKNDARESSSDHAERNDNLCSLAGDQAPERSSMNPAEDTLRNISMWNCLGNDTKDGNGVMLSLVEMEEDLDKKLEDVRERRRICEIEERNALKAYLKAQRALLEANARCANLYCERELYSSRVRSLIMDQSVLSWPSTYREGVWNHIDSSKNKSNRANSIPSSSHLVHEEYNQSDQPMRPFSEVPGVGHYHNVAASCLNRGVVPNSKPDLRHEGSTITNSIRSSSAM